MLVYMEEIQVKEDMDKNRFFSGLPAQLGKRGSSFFTCYILIKKKDPYLLNPDPAKNLNPDPEDPLIRIRIQAVSKQYLELICMKLKEVNWKK